MINWIRKKVDKIMIVSPCICRNKPVHFCEKVRFSADDLVFPAYRKIIIAQCPYCGILKTITAKSVKQKPEPISTVTHYENNSITISESFQTLIGKIKNYLPIQSSILDVGCATGILLSLLKKEKFIVYGIEPNREAFLEAEKKLPRRIFYGTLSEFIKQHKKQFECIIYNHTLEHIENIIQEITLARSALKKNGILIIGVPNTANIIYQLRKKYWESLLPNQHIWHFNTNLIKNLLNKFGFSILDVSFSNHTRSNYPFVKKLYFKILTLCNTLLKTGEAVLVFAQKKSS